jgi:hypothetical protein
VIERVTRYCWLVDTMKLLGTGSTAELEPGHVTQLRRLAEPDPG